MTKGVIWKQLLCLLVPLVAADLVQQVYSITDSAIVGRFIGTEAVAAIGTGQHLVRIISGVFTGLSVGTSVVVAQAYGAKNSEESKKTVHTSITASIIIGILVACVGVLTCRQILVLTGTPHELISQSTLYYRIYFVGMAPVMVNSCALGVLRAVGNTKSPFYYLIMSSALNCVLDVIFVVYLDGGVGGASAATVLSEVFVTVTVVVKLCKVNDMYRLRLSGLGIDSNQLHSILKVGIPSGVQSMVIGIAATTVQYNINSFGINTVAGWSLSNKILDIIIIPIVSFRSAMTVFTGQNFGAKKMERVVKGVKECNKLCCVYAVCAIGITVLLVPMLMRIFTSDSAIIHQGTIILRFMAPAYALRALLPSFEGALRGVGKSTAVMVIAVSNRAVLRIIWLFIAGLFVHSIWLVYLSYSLTWGLNVVCIIIYYKKKGFRNEV